MKTCFVSTCNYLCSTSKWKTRRLRLETSNRLTVTVYSPSRELTVGCCLTEIRRKLVEISLFEFAHNRKGNTIFISVLEAFSSDRLSVFLGYICKFLGYVLPGYSCTGTVDC